jgi:hypothetical protein
MVESLCRISSCVPSSHFGQSSFCYHIIWSGWHCTRNVAGGLISFVTLFFSSSNNEQRTIFSSSIWFPSSGYYCFQLVSDNDGSGGLFFFAKRHSTCQNLTENVSREYNIPPKCCPILDCDFSCPSTLILILFLCHKDMQNVGLLV